MLKFQDVELTPGQAYTIRRIANHLGKIEAIVMIRWKTGKGLVESKNWLEDFLDSDFYKHEPGNNEISNHLRNIDWFDLMV